MTRFVHQRVLPLMVLGALCAFACGEFHTLRHYLPQDLVADGGGDCMGTILPTVVPLPPMTTRQYEPFILQLEAVVPPAQEDASLDWDLAVGRLPAGLYLDWRTGQISGFPMEAGTFDVTVQLSANPAFHPCLHPAQAPLKLTVEPGCESPDSCASPAPDLLPQDCVAPGLCQLAMPAEQCPADFGELITWKSSLPGPGNNWLVISNRKLDRGERALPAMAPFSHQLTLANSDTADEGQILYRLPDEWPLPAGPGQELAVQQASSAGENSSALALAVADKPAALLFNGALSQTLLTTATTGLIPAPPTFTQHHLSCTGAGDSHQCGPRRHDLLALAVAGNQPVLAVAGQSLQVDTAAGHFQFAVGAAYSHDSAALGSGHCLGVIPWWSSFMLFSRDSCPIARLGNHSQLLALGKASEAPVIYFDGSSSFAHDGEALAQYEWRLAGQPHPGLVQLSKVVSAGPKAPEWLRWLTIQSVGNYLIELEVADQQGTKSCAAELAQVEVRSQAQIDLRLELVWRTLEEEIASDSDADLLLMHPFFVKQLGPPPWSADTWSAAAGRGEPAGSNWVCSQRNPVPAYWNSLEDGEPGTGDGDGLCQIAGGELAVGKPEVITLARLNRSQKDNRYPVAVWSPPTNDRLLLVTLRVFIQGKPMYESSNKALQPGQLWHAGHIDVEFLKFQPEKGLP